MSPCGLNIVGVSVRPVVFIQTSILRRVRFTSSNCLHLSFSTFLNEDEFLSTQRLIGKTFRGVLQLISITIRRIHASYRLITLSLRTHIVGVFLITEIETSTANSSNHAIKSLPNHLQHHLVNKQYSGIRMEFSTVNIYHNTFSEFYYFAIAFLKALGTAGLDV